jgi:hypothetical protein
MTKKENRAAELIIAKELATKMTKRENRAAELNC